MSLLTLKVFMSALENSDDVAAMVADRIYPIAVPGSDEQYAKTPLPYIVVGYSGPNNEIENKDQEWEGGTDKEQVHVRCVASDIDELTDLEDTVRKEIIAYFQSLTPSDDNYGLLPDNGLTVAGDEVLFEPWKPCYGHTLTYQCEQNIEDYEQD